MPVHGFYNLQLTVFSLPKTFSFEEVKVSLLYTEECQ